jgi:N-acetylneuraminic acid mutarotase
MARRISDVQVDGSTTAEDIATWLHEHRLELASDVLASRHVLVDEWPASCPLVHTCACTPIAPGAAIYFLVSECKELDVDLATEMLLHEAAHHLAVSDEDDADAIANAIVSAFRRSGLPQWQTTTLHGAPSPRWGQSAVFTGSDVIVFGGCDDAGRRLGDGAVYAPADNVWRPLPGGGPSARCGHAAVWTGDEMLVWGGDEVGYDGRRRGTGAAYDPATERWRPLRSAGAPAQLDHVTAAWNGDVWLVCGAGGAGHAASAAAFYRPATDAWRSLLDASVCARRGHTVSWLEASPGAGIGRFVIWGGTNALGQVTNDGFLYDPVRNEVEPITADGAPGAREGHVTFVSGQRLIIAFGRDASGQPLGDGAAFDLATKTWTGLSETAAPAARFGATATTTNGQTFIFGGALTPATQPSPRTHDRLLGIYTWLDESWYGLQSSNAPSGRVDHSAVWIGDGFFVWGGHTLPDATGAVLTFADGAIFRP